jgi:hypothetical protein
MSDTSQASRTTSFIAQVNHPGPDIQEMKPFVEVMPNPSINTGASR